jgi:hypothetical protein
MSCSKSLHRSSTVRFIPIAICFLVVHLAVIELHITLHRSKFVASPKFTMYSGLLVNDVGDARRQMPRADRDASCLVRLLRHRDQTGRDIRPPNRFVFIVAIRTRRVVEAAATDTAQLRVRQRRLSRQVHFACCSCFWSPAQRRFQCNIRTLLLVEIPANIPRRRSLSISARDATLVVNVNQATVLFLHRFGIEGFDSIRFDFALTLIGKPKHNSLECTRCYSRHR